MEVAAAASQNRGHLLLQQQYRFFCEGRESVTQNGISFFIDHAIIFASSLRIIRVVQACSDL